MKLNWQPVYDKMPDGVSKIFIGEQAPTPFGHFHIRVSSMRLEACHYMSPYDSPYVLGHNKVLLGRFKTPERARDFAIEWYDTTIKELSCTSNT